MAHSHFSLAHLTALDCPPPQLIRIAAGAGYDFVGLRTIALGLPGEPRYDLNVDPLLGRETAAALADTGVKFWDIELARIVDDQDPRESPPGAGDRRRAWGASCLDQHLDPESRLCHRCLWHPLRSREAAGTDGQSGVCRMGQLLDPGWRARGRLARPGAPTRES